MFKLYMLIEDTKLPKALIALDGMGYDLHVTPVKGVAPHRGKLRESAVGSGKQMIVAFLQKHLPVSGAAISAQEIIKGTGVDSKNAYNSINRLKMDGVLRSACAKGQYTINPNQLG